MPAFEGEFSTDAEEADLVEWGGDGYEVVFESDTVVFDLEYPLVFVAENRYDAFGRARVLHYICEQLLENFKKQVALPFGFYDAVVVDTERDCELVAVLSDVDQSFGGSDEAVVLRARFGVVGVLLRREVEREVAALVLLVSGDRFQYFLQGMRLVDSEILILILWR